MQGRLYLVVTPRPHWSMGETLDRTERALAGGVEVLQLRAKDWEARAILELGERMRALAQGYGVPFVLNDRPDLAALLGADGVHLGYVRWAAEHLRAPWFAIGGIDLSNLDQVLEAGARRVVVVRAILDAEDPERAARAFRERLYGVA